METPFAMYDALTALQVPPDKVRVVVQSMERDMAMFATHSQFSAFDQQAAGRFELLRAEFAASREWMSQFERRFEQMEKRFEQVDKRLEQVDERFEQVDRRFAQVDARFVELSTQMVARFNLLETRMVTMQQHIEQRLTIRLGAFMAVAVATLATVLKLIR
ncbi:MAG: hypothetical protein JSR15_06930 [Proteobacteria bacterium]|nr:hypothetical protein [Pseudomonadota bacterium]